jgi:protein-tyrosine phosphatase
MTRVLFVCLGNICRSPLAEGILRRQAEERGVEIEVDSAGTGDYHIGELADPRARSVGEGCGCRMTMRARQVAEADFERFDLIVAMDHANHRALLRWPGSRPEKVRLARAFDPDADGEVVPDPYYGTREDFESVAAMLERACASILDTLSDKRAS